MIDGVAEGVLTTGGGGITVRVKVVEVAEVPSGLPVALTWNAPVGVAEVVEMVSTLEPVGVTEGGSNEHEAPEGRVEAAQDNATV